MRIKRMHKRLSIALIAFTVIVVAVFHEPTRPLWLRSVGESVSEMFKSNQLYSRSDININDRDVLVMLNIPRTGILPLTNQVVRHANLERPCFCKWYRTKCQCLNTNNQHWLFNSHNNTGFVCGENAGYSEIKNSCPIDYWFRTTGHDRRNYRRYHLVTMLRDPITRYISEWQEMKSRDWYFLNEPRLWRKQPPELQKKGMKCLVGKKIQELTLDEFVACPNNPANNRMTRMLSNQHFVNSMNLTSKVKYNQALLVSAKNVLRRTAFFGLYHRPEDSQSLLEEVLGARLNVTLSFKSMDDDNSPLPPATRHKIMLANDLDVKLFTFAKELFDSRVTEWQQKHEKEIAVAKALKESLEHETLGGFTSGEVESEDKKEDVEGEEGEEDSTTTPTPPTSTTTSTPSTTESSTTASTPTTTTEAESVTVKSEQALGGSLLKLGAGIPGQPAAQGGASGVVPMGDDVDEFFKKLAAAKGGETNPQVGTGAGSTQPGQGSPVPTQQTLGEKFRQLQGHPGGNMMLQQLLQQQQNQSNTELASLLSAQNQTGLGASVNQLLLNQQQQNGMAAPGLSQQVGQQKMNLSLPELQLLQQIPPLAGAEGQKPLPAASGLGQGQGQFGGLLQRLRQGAHQQGQMLGGNLQGSGLEAGLSQAAQQQQQQMFEGTTLPGLANADTLFDDVSSNFTSDTNLTSDLFDFNLDMEKFSFDMFGNDSDSDVADISALGLGSTTASSVGLNNLASGKQFSFGGISTGKPDLKQFQFPDNKIQGNPSGSIGGLNQKFNLMGGEAEADKQTFQKDLTGLGSLNGLNANGLGSNTGLSGHELSTQSSQSTGGLGTDKASGLNLFDSEKDTGFLGSDKETSFLGSDKETSFLGSDKDTMGDFSFGEDGTTASTNQLPVTQHGATEADDEFSFDEGVPGKGFNFDSDDGLIEENAAPQQGLGATSGKLRPKVSLNSEGGFDVDNNAHPSLMGDDFGELLIEKKPDMDAFELDKGVDKNSELGAFEFDDDKSMAGTGNFNPSDIPVNHGSLNSRSNGGVPATMSGFGGSNPSLTDTTTQSSFGKGPLPTRLSANAFETEDIPSKFRTGSFAPTRLRSNPDLSMGTGLRGSGPAVNRLSQMTGDAVTRRTPQEFGSDAVTRQTPLGMGKAPMQEQMSRDPQSQLGEGGVKEDPNAVKFDLLSRIQSRRMSRRRRSVGEEGEERPYLTQDEKEVRGMFV